MRDLMISIAAVFAVLVGMLGEASGQPSCKAWKNPKWTGPTQQELREAELVCQDPAGAVSGPSKEDVGVVQAAPPQGPYGGGVGILAASTETEEARVRIPCWVAQDPCTGAYKVPVGTAWGIIDTSWWADNWFDGATDDCSLNTYAGAIPDGGELVVFLHGVWGMDNDTGHSGCVKVYFRVEEYESTDCTGTMTRGPYADDVQWASTSVGGRGHRQAWCDNKADCAGDWGDTCDGDANWHLPDILFSDNVVDDYRSYKIKVYTYKCDSNCTTNCTQQDADTDGCFYVYWD